MNPNLSRVVLRPRGVLEVLDLSFVFLRTRWRPVLRLSWIMLLPPLLVLAPVGWLLGFPPWLALLPPIGFAVIQAPFVVLGGRLMFADDARVGDVLRDCWSRAPGVVGATFVDTAMVVVGVASCGTLLLLMAGIAFVWEAVLLERVALRQAVTRSTFLAGGGAIEAVVAVAARWGLALWGGATLDLLGNGMLTYVFQLPPVLGSMVEGEASLFFLAGMLLVQPLAALYRLLLYINVRTRIEGWDIQVALRAVGMAA